MTTVSNNRDDKTRNKWKKKNRKINEKDEIKWCPVEPLDRHSVCHFIEIEEWKYCKAWEWQIAVIVHSIQPTHTEFHYAIRTRCIHWERVRWVLFNYKSVTQNLRMADYTHTHTSWFNHNPQCYSYPSSFCHSQIFKYFWSGTFLCTSFHLFTLISYYPIQFACRQIFYIFFPCSSIDVVWYIY